jgi:hypothetical protein
VSKPTIKQLICRSRGIKEAEKFEAFALRAPQILAETAQELMSNIPPTFGACAMISSMWAAYLQDHFSVPAIVVAGDLKLGSKTIFKCKKNLPEPKQGGRIISSKWDGHCWIEIDGWIGDLSLFRTAYRVEGPSHLKNFVMSHFGPGKGACICSKNDLPEELKYVPKFVLKDNQINSLVVGLTHQLENGI